LFYEKKFLGTITSAYGTLAPDLAKRLFPPLKNASVPFLFSDSDGFTYVTPHGMAKEILSNKISAFSEDFVSWIETNKTMCTDHTLCFIDPPW
jgi:hypothetical protein